MNLINNKSSCFYNWITLKIHKNKKNKREKVESKAFKKISFIEIVIMVNVTALGTVNGKENG
jgi:hypothetical protein